MKQRTQNIAVGITVIVAFLILAGLITMFTSLPEMFQPGYEIEMLFERTGDTHTGDVVYTAGIAVGRITDIRFTDPNDVRKGVTLTARINGDVRLPGNVEAQMFTRGVAGTPYLQLVPEGPVRKHPDTGEVMEYLPTDRVSTIPGRHKASGLLPQEITDAVKDLSKLAGKIEKTIDALGDLGPAVKGFSKLMDNLNSLFAEEAAAAPTASTAVPTAPAETRPAPGEQKGVKATLAKMGKLIDGLNAIVGDPENQKNLKTSLANLAQASAQAKETLKSLSEFSEEARKTAGALGDRTEDLMQKLIQDAEKLSAILTGFEKAAVSIEQQEGTIGKLVYDTELYNNLVESSKALARALEQLQELLKEWKTSGVKIQMK